jgi:hypothetical protein
VFLRMRRTMFRGCCGQPRRQRRPKDRPLLPPNPKVREGVRLLYLGVGEQRLQGRSTDLVYHVSQYRRLFKADVEDASALLRRRDLILAP